MDLLLHPQAQQRYDITAANPPQSILLVAPEGSGKESILRALANDILGDHPAGRLFELEPLEDKKNIAIDQIRELKVSMRLKLKESRVVLITHAELLTPEAQNSLLKLLEEPPAHVHFLLAVTKLSDVLDTIQSRTAVWRLTLPTKAQLSTYFADKPSEALAKAIAIGQSRVGLISSVLGSEQNHELLDAIEVAKEILGEQKFDRMIRVDALSKDPPQTRLIIEAFELICKAALENAAGNNNPTVKQWHKRLTLVTNAEQSLNQNVQAKLVLSHLFMTI